MLVVHSLNDIPIRLTEERWQHIVHRHPEMTSQRDRVLDTGRARLGARRRFGRIARHSFLSQYTIDQQVFGRGLSGNQPSGWSRPDGLSDQSTLGKENSSMATVKILERPTTIDWDYDEDADVLYLSIGEPKPAIGIDIGDGLVLRYDESQHEVVGLTVIGLQTRLQKGLSALPGGVVQN
jgi:uncharacterized protein YuzE